MRELNRVPIDQWRAATDSPRQASAAELVYNENRVIDALNYSVDGGTLVRDSIIDDLSREPPIAAIGSNWQLLTDQVMGGVSKGTMVRAAVAGRAAICMRGDVSLEGYVPVDVEIGEQALPALSH